MNNSNPSVTTSTNRTIPPEQGAALPAAQGNSTRFEAALRTGNGAANAEQNQSVQTTSQHTQRHAVSNVFATAIASGAQKPSQAGLGGHDPSGGTHPLTAANLRVLHQQELARQTVSHNQYFSNVSEPASLPSDPSIEAHEVVPVQIAESGLRVSALAQLNADDALDKLMAADAERRLQQSAGGAQQHSTLSSITANDTPAEGPMLRPGIVDGHPVVLEPIVRTNLSVLDVQEDGPMFQTEIGGRPVLPPIARANVTASDVQTDGPRPRPGIADGRPVVLPPIIGAKSGALDV